MYDRYRRRRRSWSVQCDAVDREKDAIESKEIFAASAKVGGPVAVKLKELNNGFLPGWLKKPILQN